jgi:polyisoprenoid-binding protein YceI
MYCLTETTMNNEVTQGIAIYDIDSSHSTVEFKVRHLGFSKVTGRFTKFSGAVEMDGDDLSTLTADLTVDVASITTGDDKRDEHLRSADFFEIERFPELTFRADEVSSVSDDAFTLDGELSMHGVSKRVQIKGEFLGTATDPWGGSRVGFQGSTKLNRKDYGLKWNQTLETGGVLVGETVEISLDIQAVRRSE